MLFYSALYKMLKNYAIKLAHFVLNTPLYCMPEAWIIIKNEKNEN